MKVINIFAGPGSGKSTLAYGLMYLLKINGYKVEMAYEYAKELVYDNLYYILEHDQYRIFREQNLRVQRFQGGNVDFVVTDCPSLVGLTYTSDEYFDEHPYFEPDVVATFKSYDNYNIFLKRTVNYIPEGRVQKDIEIARKVDEKMRLSLNKHNIQYVEYDPKDMLIFAKIFKDLNLSIVDEVVHQLDIQV